MNLQPAKKHEPVTILMVPLDRYSAFLKCVDTLYKETHWPFKLVLVEGNAPEGVRHELEKRKQKHGNMRILYSDHHPRMAEALNLGLVHVRTKHVVLMHNGLLVTAGWLSNLMEHARVESGVLCPYISQTQEESLMPLPVCLLTKELLENIGLFDESVSTALLGADFMNLLKAKHVPVHKKTASILHHAALPAPKGTDLKLFRHQWEDLHAHQTLAYFRQKWGIAPEEAKYREWLAKKRTLSVQKPVFPMPMMTAGAPLRIPDPKISFKKFLQVLRA
jgi:hypothetical protein